jgi:hypothetical protein
MVQMVQVTRDTGNRTQARPPASSGRGTIPSHPPPKRTERAKSFYSDSSQKSRMSFCRASSRRAYRRMSLVTLTGGSFRPALRSARPWMYASISATGSRVDAPRTVPVPVPRAARVPRGAPPSRVTRPCRGGIEGSTLSPSATVRITRRLVPVPRYHVPVL